MLINGICHRPRLGDKMLKKTQKIAISKNFLISMLFVCLVFAILLMALSRMVSLGSITAAILYPVLVLVLPGEAFNDKWEVRITKQGKKYIYDIYNDSNLVDISSYCG